MYFAHISIGGGIVGVETVISTFDNICSSLKNKNIPVEIVSSHYVDPKGERVRS